MRGSSAAILLLGLSAVAICHGAGTAAALTLLEGRPAWMLAAAAGLSGLLLTAPAGLACLPLIRRRAASVRASLEPQADASASAAPPPDDWLLGPAARFAAGVAEAWRRHCEDLRARLKQVEIRHRVAEAERDHVEGILHSLRDAVIVTDAFNELTLANEPAARLLGFRLDDAIHKPIDQVVGDASLRQLIKEVRSSGLLNKEKHVEHRLSTGEENPASPAPCFDVTLAAIPGHAGAPSDAPVGGVVTILRDITREKEISQMKSDFVSQASHELRTPISAINAYTEMLLDSEAQDEAGRQEFYKIIKAEAERLSRMIDNMLNISRIEAGIVSVDRTEVDFVKVLGEVIETMQAPAKEKNITLTAKSGPLIYTAEADRDLVYQVMMNLVSNAIKYTPADGRVSVSVENDDTTRSVLVTVADTGLGIPPDAIDKIFDKFYRIENYKRVAKGTGLGLNLVRHIVETVHAGRVGVTSQVGLGSKFWFTIPYEYKGGSDRHGA